MKEVKTTRGSAIGIIVQRAANIAEAAGRPFNPFLTAKLLKRYHERRRALRLTDMAKGDDFSLAHDVFGILDGRDFIPRYCVRQ